MTDKPHKPGPFSADGLDRMLAEIPAEPCPLHLPRHLTYAAVVDVKNAETEITDLMIRRACKEAEALQVFPFAGGRAKSTD